jgi:hypothetical protein
MVSRAAEYRAKAVISSPRPPAPPPGPPAAVMSMLAAMVVPRFLLPRRLKLGLIDS